MLMAHVLPFQELYDLCQILNIFQYQGLQIHQPTLLPAPLDQPMLLCLNHHIEEQHLKK